MTSLTQPSPRQAPAVWPIRHDSSRETVPDVEIVIPTYNEEGVLDGSIRCLHRFLSAQLPFTWRILIADNASVDRTPQIAEALAAELAGVAVLRLTAKGRGRALRAAWTASDARAVCYMDVDLSTDLRGLLPLVGAVLSGHSDVAIGTRLARGARVTRCAKRELISRVYNRLLRLVLRARFSDAQCGFKAMSRQAARTLLPEVDDEQWFFDTELLIRAQRRGLRIHEVPVDWVEDPDSRVEIASTVLDDLRGVARLALGGPLVCGRTQRGGIAPFRGVNLKATRADNDSEEIVVNMDRPALRLSGVTGRSRLR